MRDLQILIRVYIERMREQKILTQQELDSLFTNIELLLPIHADILKALEAKQAENPVIMCLGILQLHFYLIVWKLAMYDIYVIGDALLERIPLMRVYASVCSNQPTIVGKIDRFSQKNKGFKAFLDVCEARNYFYSNNPTLILRKPLCVRRCALFLS